MRIVVCVKHVPDVQADRAFTPEGRVDRSQGDGTLNELDENALEAAMSLVEAHGGEVVVVTVGPDDAEDAVRRGLQLGAVAAVHVADDAVAGSDVFGTAEVLAALPLTPAQFRRVREWGENHGWIERVGAGAKSFYRLRKAG